MIFLKNNLKRVGLIFPILLAFSHNLGAVDVLHPGPTLTGPSLRDAPPCTFTNLFEAIDPKTGKKIRLLGTRHDLPGDILREEIKKIILAHTFCLKEVQSIHVALYQMLQQTERDLINQYKDLHEKLLPELQFNREAWLKTEKETTGIASEKTEEMEELYKKLEEAKEPTELGFQLLFPELVQGVNSLKFENLNEKGSEELFSPCLRIGLNRQSLEEAKLDRRYNIHEKFLREENPHWFKLPGDETNDLDQLTKEQQAILNGMFKNPTELKKFNLKGLWGLYNIALEFNGMDKTIEDWMDYCEYLDENPDCLKMRDDLDKYFKMRNDYNKEYLDIKNDFDKQADEIRTIIQNFDNQFANFIKTWNIKRDQYIKLDAYQQYMKMRKEFRKEDQFNDMGHRLLFLEWDFDKLFGHDVNDLHRTPMRKHTIEEFGKMLQQPWPDGTDYYLNTDGAKTYSVHAQKLILEKPILKGRNNLWIKDILEKFQKMSKGTLTNPETSKPINDMLLVFGANHLWGDYGILNLLYKEGFEIKRARPDGTFEDFEEYFTHEKPSTIVEGTKAEETKDPE